MLDTDHRLDQKGVDVTGLVLDRVVASLGCYPLVELWWREVESYEAIVCSLAKEMIRLHRVGDGGVERVEWREIISRDKDAAICLSWLCGHVVETLGVVLADRDVSHG